MSWDLNFTWVLRSGNLTNSFPRKKMNKIRCNFVLLQKTTQYIHTHARTSVIQKEEKFASYTLWIETKNKHTVKTRAHHMCSMHYWKWQGDFQNKLIKKIGTPIHLLHAYLNKTKKGCCKMSPCPWANNFRMNTIQCVWRVFLFLSSAVSVHIWVCVWLFVFGYFCIRCIKIICFS